MVEMPFQPLIEGEEIRLARLPVFLSSAFCTVGCLVFAFVLVAPPSWLDQTENPILRRMVASAAFVVFAVGAWQEVRPWWQQRRLLLGKNCLQLLEGDQVLGQVPYDNIATAVVGRAGRGVSVLLLPRHEIRSNQFNRGGVLHLRV